MHTLFNFTADFIDKIILGVKKIFNIMKMMFEPLKDHLPSFSYMFTKFDSSQNIVHKIELHLKDLKRGRTEKEQLFIDFLEDIVRKREMFGSLKFDPINDKAVEVYSRIFAAPKIRNPGHVVQSFVHPESYERLKNQLLKHHMSIQDSLKRFDLDLLQYKMEQLKRMNICFPFHDSEKSYDSAKAEIQKYIVGDLERCEQLIERIPTREGMETITDVVLQLVQLTSQLAHCEIMRLHLDEERIPLDLVEHCKIKVEKLAKSLHESLRTTLESEILDCEIILSKQRCLYTKFSELKNVSKNISLFIEMLVPALKFWYEESRNLICQICEVAIAACKDANPLDFEKLEINMTILKKCIEAFRTHIDEYNIEETYSSLQKSINTSVEDIVLKLKQF